MRIGLEITGALAGDSGYRTYIEKFTEELARQDKANQYFLYGAFWRGFPQRIDEVKLPTQDNFHFILRRMPQCLILPMEEYLGIKFQQEILYDFNLDLFHGLGSWAPKFDWLPTIVTLAFSGVYPFKKMWDKFYFNTLTERSVREADKVIAISDLVKVEAVSAWDVDPEKIEVIPYGGPGSEFTLAAGPHTRSYFLVVGRTRSQKNPMLAAEAFILFKRKHPELHYKLAFVGAVGDQQKIIEDRLRSECWDDVMFRGPVEHRNMPGVYQGAFALLVPSVLEGFSLPILEAMASGAPVIGVHRGAASETIWDAGIIVEPDPQSMCAAMESLVLQPDLRGDFVQRGLRRAREFSWEACVRDTLALYRRWE